MSPPTGTDDIEDADPGLAGARTELAWTRTAIAFAGVGAALLRSHPAVGIPILALSAVVWQLGRLPGTSSTGQARTRRIQLITAIVTGIAITALVITLVTGW